MYLAMEAHCLHKWNCGIQFTEFTLCTRVSGSDACNDHAHYITVSSCYNVIVIECNVVGQ